MGRLHIFIFEKSISQDLTKVTDMEATKYQSKTREWMKGKLDGTDKRTGVRDEKSDHKMR